MLAVATLGLVSAYGIDTSGCVDLEVGAVEVVVAEKAPRCVLFAADEMTNFLSRAYGCAVPLSTSFTPGRKAIVLGDCEWSRAAGLSTYARGFHNLENFGTLCDCKREP